MRNPRHDRGAFFVGESEAQCFRCGAEVQGTGGNQVMIEGGRVLTNSQVIHHRLMETVESVANGRCEVLERIDRRSYTRTDNGIRDATS